LKEDQTRQKALEAGLQDVLNNQTKSLSGVLKSSLIEVKDAIGASSTSTFGSSRTGGPSLGSPFGAGRVPAPKVQTPEESAHVKRARDWILARANEIGVDLGTELDGGLTIPTLTSLLSDSIVKNNAILLMETYNQAGYSSHDKRGDKPHFIREVVKAARAETVSP